MRSLHLAMVALPALVGCAELRTSYTPANGDAMQVYDKTVLKTGTQQVATGKDEVRDEHGNVIATNTHYENQQVSWTEREWYPMQGGARIDDESFYRITGDKDAAQKYDDWHHAGVGRNFVGWIVGAVGLGVLAGGVIAYAADSPSDQVLADGTHIPGERGAASTVGYIGMIAGGITAAVGVVLILSGKSAAHSADARLFQEPERVKADAAKYNANLGSMQASAPAAAPSPVEASPGPAIHIGAFTASIAKDKYKKIELKADGSIYADNKKVAMISGSDIKDTSGGTLFTVLADGSLRGDDLPNSKMRVESDGLVRGENKVTVADDGTIVLVKKSGVETVGKIDKGSKDKRTAVLVLAAAAVVAKQQQ